LLTIGAELGGRTAAALPWATLKDAIRDGLASVQRTRRGSVQEADFEAFWLEVLRRGGWWDQSQGAGPSAQGVSSSLRNVVSSLQPTRYAGPPEEFPYHLIVFPHQTLGVGESANLPWMQATPDPITSATWATWVELNPSVALGLGVAEGDVVSVESPNGGRIEVPVYVSPAAPPTVVGIPLGQGHWAFGRWANVNGRPRGANALDLLADLVDAETGSVAYGGTRVRLVKTGRRVQLSKFEGTAPALPLPREQVAKVTNDAS
jgi:molybdopterin-containing oxidoreductase family iron-sulfur binding subunit